MAGIKVTGLGPGRAGLITMESMELMEQAGTLILRTEIHPTVEALRERGLQFTSYDSFYQEADSFEELYSAIARDLLSRAKAGGDIVYAVPGSPLVAERTVVLLRQMAKEENVPLEIVPGMSFLEVLYARLGIDPVEGIAVLDAETLDNIVLPKGLPMAVTQVYNAQIASDVKLLLMEHFPDDYEVTYVHHLALPDESIREMPLFELDRQKDIDHLTSIYLKKYMSF